MASSLARSWAERWTSRKNSSSRWRLKIPFGWAAEAAAVAGLAGSAMQSSAISDAADTAASEQRSARETARADLQSYTQVGNNALGPAQNLLGLNGPDAASTAMENFTASPGYQYQLD